METSCSLGVLVSKRCVRGTSLEQRRSWGFRHIPAAPEPILDILALNSGSMLLAHFHGFGLISSDAKVIPLHGLGSLDVGPRDGPLVSADGGTVQVDGLDVTTMHRTRLRTHTALS